MKLNFPKKKKQPITSPALLAWRALPTPANKTKAGKPIPVMTSLRGNPDAKILLIGPACTEEEYEHGVPMSDGSAQVFHELLYSYAGISTQDDCFVISCSRFGEKTNKASTEPIREFLSMAMRSDQFKLILSVGDDAFKHTFGRGKKPSMATLAGNIMYVPETRHRPLFVFPNIDALEIDVRDMPRRDAMRALDWSDKERIKFTNLCVRLGKAVEKIL